MSIFGKDIVSIIEWVNLAEYQTRILPRIVMKLPNLFFNLHLEQGVSGPFSYLTITLHTLYSD